MNKIMNNRMKRWLGASVLCLVIGSGQNVVAQQVIFPQEVQADKAHKSGKTKCARFEKRNVQKS